MNNLSIKELNNLRNSEDTEQFLSLRVSGQLFGIPVIKVIDVLKPVRLTSIPLASPEIKGLMNLRGRIVTVIDLRISLGIHSNDESEKKMFVVVESKNELYALVCDEVGEAETLNIKEFDKNPENISASLRKASRGVSKFENELMLILDINSLINLH